LVIHSTCGTTSATTNIDIDIATPIKDKEEYATKNKKQLNTTITTLLRKHKHRLHSLQPAHDKNYHQNNVPFFYNLTKIKRYPFMIVLIH
jgi:cytochrome oxidase assembly protein ShyY1